MQDTHGKLETLRESLSTYEKGLAVAFSGGADSSLVLRLAHDLLGNRVVALHLHSPLHRLEDLHHARQMAQAIGASFFEVLVDPLDWPEFVENTADRCYLCKKKIYTEFQRLIAIHSFGPLADGTNADDMFDHRPGLRALRELNVITPLAEVGLTKDEVRTVSRQLGLMTWNRPSGSCLATRIPSGSRICRENLKIVDSCEKWLEERGFTGTRARLLGDRLLVELQRGQTKAYFIGENDRNFHQFCAQFGIRKVYLDTDGR